MQVQQQGEGAGNNEGQLGQERQKSLDAASASLHRQGEADSPYRLRCYVAYKEGGEFMFDDMIRLSCLKDLLHQQTNGYKKQIATSSHHLAFVGEWLHLIEKKIASDFEGQKIDRARHTELDTYLRNLRLEYQEFLQVLKDGSPC